MIHRRFITALCAICMTTCISAAQTASRTMESFDFDWQFHLTMEKDAEDQAGPRLRTAIEGWETVQLPHDWSIHMIPDSRLTGCNGHLRGGTGEYRKTFKVDKKDKGRNISIIFDGIYNRSTVSVNGHKLGFRPYGFVQIEYDLTPYLKWGEDNEIYVKVDNPSDNDHISRWYTGSGIYRHAWLVKTSPTHIRTNGTYIVTKDNKRVVITTDITGSTSKRHKIIHKIYDADGQPVATGTDGKEINIPSPHLWNGMSDPYLYKVETILSDGRKTLDIYESHFGIRTVEFTTDRGFLLNGKPLKLKGFCLHQDDACLGSALPIRSMERRLEIFRDYGVNAIRCSHNPPAPEFLDLCDRFGFIVIDEAFDKWKSGYYAEYFDDWWEKDLRNMIERDRNHPCVAVWSIGNELQEAWDSGNEGVKRARMLQDFVHKLEPSRQVCMACQNRHQEKFSGVTDVVGYNYLESRMLSDHKKIPDRRFLVTEELPYYCGAEGNIRAYDTNNPWNIIESNEFIAGGFIWTGQDYIGEAMWPSCGWPCGLLYLSGKEKPRGIWHRSRWNLDTPVVGISVRDESLDIDHGRDLWQWPNIDSRWNFPFSYEGLVMEVQTITNCEKVELKINNKIMGVKNTSDFANHTIVWHVPYSRGRIEAHGINGTDTVAHYEITTAGEPTAMKIEADRTELHADGQDLCYIQMQLVDDKGVEVYHRERKITGTIEGEGKLLGLINNDLRRTTPFTSTEDNTHFGSAFAIVQTTRNAGRIKLHLNVEGIDNTYDVEMTSH